MSKFLLIAMAMVAPSATTFTVSPAEARDRAVLAGGPAGGAFVGRRQVSRERGSAQVSRGILTRSGRGQRETRSTQWGDGAVHHSVVRTVVNGSTVTRDGSIVRDVDGSVSKTRARIGAAGNTQLGWSTIYRTDDGYSRSRGGSTSAGRGYSASRDVSVAHDAVTIDRQLTTNSGRSTSSSRIYSIPRW